MALHLRPGTSEDYPAIVALRNYVTPELATSVQKMSLDDDVRPEHCAFGLICVEEEDRLVGYGRFAQYADLYQPGKFFINICVHPDFRERGTATKLLQALHAALEPLNPRILRATVREDRVEAVRWALRQGFQEASCRITATLEVTDFDCDAYTPLMERLSAKGITLKSVAEAQQDDPQHVGKLHVLFTRVDADVPTEDTVTALSRQQFVKQVLHAPYFDASGSFVAQDGREYIGLNFVFKAQPDVLDIDLTGTERGYRRRGVATALKVKGIAYAQNADIHTIRTTTDATNAAIISINERMGFVPQPALIQLVRHI